MEELSEVKDLLDTVIGDSKRDYAGTGGWYEYDCPECQDGKYNLAVQINESKKLWAHCWVCGMHGSLYNIIKKYGNIDQVEEYKRIIQNYQDKHLYDISFGGDDGIINTFEDIHLPNGYRQISFNDNTFEEISAIKYLLDRGLSKKDILSFKIGYIETSSCDEYKMRNRVVIPSYDRFNQLTYWVARDYTKVNKLKVMNPITPKKDVIFNEGRINIYEPITIVEGPFDHMAVPNSIPLLGKSIKDSATYNMLLHKCKTYINIMLDGDAYNDAIKMYMYLNESPLHGRVKIIQLPTNMDPSDVYKFYGHKGIIRLLASARELSDFETSKYSIEKYI